MIIRVEFTSKPASDTLLLSTVQFTEYQILNFNVNQFAVKLKIFLKTKIFICSLATE